MILLEKQEVEIDNRLKPEKEDNLQLEQNINNNKEHKEIKEDKNIMAVQ